MTRSPSLEKRGRCKAMPIPVAAAPIIQLQRGFLQAFGPAWVHRETKYQLGLMLRRCVQRHISSQGMVLGVV